MTYERVDLAPEERDLDALLFAAPPAALPVGFRDTVLSRIRSERRVGWELIVAALFALPSMVYLGRLVLVHGDDILSALSNVVLAASTDARDAFFFVDGLTVIALALLGIASAFAAHALAVTSADTRRVAR